MPLFIPIMIGAGVLAAVGYGSKKGYDGIGDSRAAKRLTEEATARHSRHVRILDSARTHLSKRVEGLHELRKETARTTFGRMVEILQALERRGHVKSAQDLEELGGSPEEVRAFVGQFVEAGGLIQGGVAAAGAASGASAVATSLVSTFATAGTGTAISGLSGAAANSAILAWLGGGSIAAGGWGMAGGAIVMSGIAVGPAVLVSGVVLAAQGAKAHVQATKYAAEIDVAVQQIGALVALLHRGERRVEELTTLTQALSDRAHSAMAWIEDIVPTFDGDNGAHIERLRSALLLCGALRQVMECRVLDDRGELDAGAGEIIERFRELASNVPELAA